MELSGDTPNGVGGRVMCRHKSYRHKAEPDRVLVTVLASLAFVTALWIAQTAPASACQTTPCNQASPIAFELIAYALGIPGAVQATGQPRTADDPYVGFTSVFDKGASMSSATGVFGAVNGLSQSSHTTDISAGANASYNPSKTFNLGTNQRLVVTGLFQYDSVRSTFNANPAIPAVLASGTDHVNTYTFGGLAQYFAGDMYYSGFLSGTWGSGGATNGATGGTGNFSTSGYATGFNIGKTFTLFGSNAAPDSPMPTKAPPRPAATGNSLGLFLDAGLYYANNRAGGFTDTTGFVRGTEELHYWDFNAQATLVGTILDNGLTWHPYLGVTLDQQFGFSNTLGIPTQALSAADVISYGSAQTFIGPQAGLSATLSNGLILGVMGFYRQSAEFQVAGGQAYVLYRFPE
jgi:hypothetical protein